MNKEEFNFKTKMIKENFNDTRTIKCETPESERQLDEGVYPGGDVFTTEEGDYIDFELQLEDFDEEELAKYIGFAENLYEKHHKHVSVYLLCPKNINVCVREQKILSDADFSIKLACDQTDPCHMILKIIKRKINNNEYLNADDLHIIEKLPVMCAKKDRHYFRVESIKIINRYFH